MSYDSEHDSHHTLKPINMSFRHPPHPPQFFPPPPPFAATNEAATTFWHENLTDNHQAKPVLYPESTLLKKPRIIEDNPSESFPTHVSNPAMPLPNPPSPRGVGKIFRKTRICSKFIEGTCPFGYNCNFAHGTQDLRKPPPNWRELVTSFGDDRLGNWDEDQKIIYRMKLCTRFSNGQECPYGEKCNYFHEDPAKFRDREVSVISITGNPVNNSSGSEDPVVSGTTGPTFDSSKLNQKPYWKTKMCNKWESGHCPYGDNCHYAHGITELHKFGGHSEVETATTGKAPSRLLPRSTNDVSQSDMGIGDSNQQMLSKKQLILAKKLGKINRIYGDWIDDLPPMRSTPNEEN